MSTCNLFDKYRDKELDIAGQKQFDLHLAKCPDCRIKFYLLNNVAGILRQGEPIQVDVSGKVARRAFEQKKTWDMMIVSWLHPVPALAALILAVLVLSFLWLQPGYRLAPPSEYETLMNDADSVNLETTTMQVRSDSDLMIWLEQEDISQ
jgi:hypothetical protein